MGDNIFNKFQIGTVQKSFKQMINLKWTNVKNIIFGLLDCYKKMYGMIGMIGNNIYMIVSI